MKTVITTHSGQRVTLTMQLDCLMIYSTHGDDNNQAKQIIERIEVMYERYQSFDADELEQFNMAKNSCHYTAVKQEVIEKLFEYLEKQKMFAYLKKSALD